MATQHNDPKREIWRGAAVVAAAGALALLLVCGIGAFAVHQGAVALQWFDVRLGGLRVVGYATWNANCPPFTGCDPTLDESYVVWLVTEQHAGAPHSQRLLRLPIEH